MDKLDVQRGTRKVYQCICSSLRPSRSQYPPQPYDFNFPNPNTLGTGTFLAQEGESDDYVLRRVIRSHLQFMSTSNSDEDGNFY